MKFLPLRKMWERFELSLRDSDAAAFFDLMCLGELLVKSAVLGLVAAVDSDKERHQYGLLHRLVRADGIGDWDQVLQEILTGSAAHLLRVGAQPEQKELTMRVAPDSWQYEAVSALHKCLKIVNPKEGKLPDKIDGHRWFSIFVQLRNGTRGHGAHVASVIGKLTPPLKSSLQLVSANYCLFARPWAYVHRSLSGKYRFTPLSAGVEVFERPDTSIPALTDGVYWYLDRPLLVPLLQSTPEAFDFFYPNGAFNERRFELVSYITGTTTDGDATLYLEAPSKLPPSATQGLGILDVRGGAFTNLPSPPTQYVTRTDLDKELRDVLEILERHQVITIFGRGGIGKTSLALNVLNQFAHEGHYAAILWFSARDIDLLPDKPLPVAPSVLTPQDVSKEFSRLTQPAGHLEKTFDHVAWFEKCLREPQLGPTLFVFDNFETMRHPLDVFRWLDVNVRSPNKVLITTRHHDFKGDYPIEVDGMNREECDRLIEQTAASLGIASWVTREYKQELYSEAAGHPYVVKILLGEAKKAGHRVRTERILADKDRILDALFERTYARLSPPARRTFLTLSSWGTSIPELAVEAVLLQAKHERFDVIAAVDELVLSSFITRSTRQADGISVVDIPLVAVVFGRKKLSVEAMKIEVDEDTQLLRMLASSPGATAQDLVAKIFKNAASQIGSGTVRFCDVRPLLEFISSKIPYGWILLSELHEESGEDANLESAKSALKCYLEATPRGPDQVKAWERLASLCERSEDFAGVADAEASLCEVPEVPLRRMSNAAEHVLIMLKKVRFLSRPFEYRRKVKQTIPRIASMIAARASGCGVTEFNRLAWLSLVVDDEASAKTWTERGLAIDPDNVHCLSLAQRLGMRLS
ncbi:MAG: NB-ARC domain-containing protein [Bryobacteraceae bacterium]